MQKPFPQSYWVHAGFLCAGHYPGALDDREHTEKLAGLVQCNIRRVISLIPSHETGRGGQPFRPYVPDLQQLAAEQGSQIECIRLGYPDGTTPTHEQMAAILDAIDMALAAKEPVYVHCWGGHGRTGTTVACHLIRHGYPAQAAIDQIIQWRADLPRNHFPFEGQQEKFVRAWRAGE